jgi:hypothetical protein
VIVVEWLVPVIVVLATVVVVVAVMVAVLTRNSRRQEMESEIVHHDERARSPFELEVLTFYLSHVCMYRWMDGYMSVCVFSENEISSIRSE